MILRAVGPVKAVDRVMQQAACQVLGFGACQRVVLPGRGPELLEEVDLSQTAHPGMKADHPGESTRSTTAGAAYYERPCGHQRSSTFELTPRQSRLGGATDQLLDSAAVSCHSSGNHTVPTCQFPLRDDPSPAHAMTL